MLILYLDKERTFKKGDVITINVEETEVLETEADTEMTILTCTELGPPVPVEGKLAEVLEENAKLKQFVKSIVEMEPRGFNNCPVCWGWHEHKAGCLFVKAHETLALLTRC